MLKKRVKEYFVWAITMFAVLVCILAISSRAEFTWWAWLSVVVAILWLVLFGIANKDFLFKDDEREDNV